MRLVPLGDKVVVRRTDAEQKSPGGIHLPETAAQRPRQGRVLSVGDGCRLANGGHAKPRVGEGDRVLFDRFAGTEVVVDGDELLIMNEDDILGIMS